MSDTLETSDPAAFDVAIERTKKALARNPQISAADLFTRFIEPLLGELRSEYSEQLDSINDALDDLELPDEDVLEQAKQLILLLGNLVDNTLTRVGWISPEGPTEEMPADIQRAFQQAAGETRALFERLAEIEESEDEDDEEDGEESEEAEPEASA